MFVSFVFEFRNFFNSRHHPKVGGNSDSRQRVAIRRSLGQNMNICEKQQNYYVTSTSRIRFFNFHNRVYCECGEVVCVRCVASGNVTSSHSTRRPVTLVCTSLIRFRFFFVQPSVDGGLRNEPLNTRKLRDKILFEGLIKSACCLFIRGVK